MLSTITWLLGGVHPHQQYQSDVEEDSTGALRPLMQPDGRRVGWDGDQAMKDDQHRAPLSRSLRGMAYA